MVRLVATAAPAGGSKTSGGAFAGVQDMGVELGFCRLAFEVHALTRKVLTLVWLDRRAADSGTQRKEEREVQWAEGVFSPGFSGAK